MCAGQTIEQSEIQSTNNCSSSNVSLCSYNFSYQLPGTPGCGKVSIERNTDQLGALGGTGTSIIARGYNFCQGTQPDINNSTLVERRLEVWYPNALPAPDPAAEPELPE